MSDEHIHPNGHSEEPASGDQLRLPKDMLPSSLPDHELGALIEALLLVSPEPPTVEELSAGTELPQEEIERGLAWLEQQDSRGWILQRHGRRIQLATAPRFAEKVRLFLGLDREAKLSSASLEVLALVAYQQPITRSEIEAVRGVDSSGILAKLHARGLIEPVARLQTVGNPIQYGTTAEFLNHFGLRSLADLPPLGDIGGKDGKAMLEAATLVEPESPDDQDKSDEQEAP